MISAATERPTTLLERMDARLPSRYRGVEFLDYDGGRSPDAGRAKAAAIRFADGEGDALVLVGRPGVGKTMLAAAVCRHIASVLEAESAELRASIESERAEAEAADTAWYLGGRVGPAPERPPYRSWGRGALLPWWLNVAETLVDLRAEFGASESPMASDVASLRQHRGILVLDDLGRERASDWTSEVVYTLVNARYEARLRTVVTSNIPLADLAQSTYWPVISRLADNGLLVELDAKDQRLAARAR